MEIIVFGLFLALSFLAPVNYFSLLSLSQSLAVGPLPLALWLLCLMQTSGSTENEMDGIHFKLLYHGEVTGSKGVSHA